MKPRLISILVASLFAPALGYAQEAQPEWSGSVSIGVRGVGINANDPSKFNEYRDLERNANVFGGFELRKRGENDYLNAYGENIGRDDQYLNLSGGRYGAAKYQFYSDQMRHNFGSGPGARTPFNGVGSSTLPFMSSPVNRDPQTWNTFDHSYKRHNLGAMFELQSKSPWYFRLDANQVTREGINVFAGAKGTSPGNGFADLPSPIDYTTRNGAIEGGFSNKRVHFSVNLMRSVFENNNSFIRWQNDYFGGGPALLDTSFLPPNNELTRLAINGNIRGLPAESTLAARYTYQKTESNVAMAQNMLSTGATNPATNPSDATFNGDHQHTTMSLSLTSHLAAALDTKIYWNYDKLKNESTDITFNPPVGSGLRSGSTNPIVNCANVAGVVCEPELFHYTKKNLGVEGNYRLTRDNKLSAGFDYTDTERERADFPKTKEKRLFAEWKTSSLDWVTGRIKYQYMVRDSDFEANASVLAANPIDLYVRRFDLANVHQNQLKLALDANPAPLADIGLEIILKKNDYIDTPLGRKDDTRQEYYVSAGYGDAKAFRVFTFGDIEYTEYNSDHRNDGGNATAGNPGLADPATPPTATLYNWSARNKDKAWQIGVGADWVPHTRFTIKSSLIYAETNGRADFSVQPGGPTTVFQPITNFDNTQRLSLTLRGVYEYTRTVEFTGGYSYERYRYSDIGYDNTKYIVGTATTTSGNSNAYTTGQFAFQNYSANILFGIVKFKF